MTRVAHLFLALVTLCMSHTVVAAADRISERNSAMARMGAITMTSGKKLPYYRTVSMTEKNETIKTVLIIVPGGESNGPGYFAAGIEAARGAGALPTTAVVTPQFQMARQNPRQDELYWTSHWQQGADSLDGSQTSSFAVLDRILELAVASFPNASRVVLAGHSSGGQIINRYIAVGSAIADHKSIVFVVMNPSSYLYVDDRRMQSDGSYAPLANAAAVCPGYNHWKYGLVGPPPYAAKLSVDEIRNRMFRRKVVFLAGSADTLTGDGVDHRCPALVQGKTRLDRTLNYWGYVQTFPQWKENATLSIVPGIGHSGGELIRSSQFRNIVFKN